MSKKTRQERATFLPMLSDEQFLILYAMRMARLRIFQKLNAPRQIIENEVLLIDEAHTEGRNRSFCESRLKNAMNDKRLLRCTRRWAC